MKRVDSFWAEASTSEARIQPLVTIPVACHWPARGCCCSVTKLCLTLCTPCTKAGQAPLSMEFSRQEYWSGPLPSCQLPFPSSGDLRNPHPALAGRFSSTEPPEKPENTAYDPRPATHQQEGLGQLT